MVATLAKASVADSVTLTEKPPFEQIYEESWGRIYGYCLKNVGNTHTAEDLASETFSKALAAYEEFEYRNVPIGAWITRIARNTITDFVRRSKERDLGELPEVLVDPRQVDPAVTAVQISEIEQLRLAVAKLPEGQREVIILRFVSDLSVDETARALGKREQNIRTMVFRAIQKLRLLMAAPKEEEQPTQLIRYNPEVTFRFETTERVRPTRQEEMRKMLMVEEVTRVAMALLTEGFDSRRSLSSREALEHSGYTEWQYYGEKDSRRVRLALRTRSDRGPVTPSQFLALKVANRLEKDGYSVKEVFAVWEKLPRDFFENLLKGIGGEASSLPVSVNQRGLELRSPAGETESRQRPQAQTVEFSLQEDVIGSNRSVLAGLISANSAVIRDGEVEQRRQALSIIELLVGTVRGLEELYPTSGG